MFMVFKCFINELPVMYSNELCYTAKSVLVNGKYNALPNNSVMIYIKRVHDKSHNSSNSLSTIQYDSSKFLI